MTTDEPMGPHAAGLDDDGYRRVSDVLATLKPIERPEMQRKLTMASQPLSAQQSHAEALRCAREYQKFLEFHLERSQSVEDSTDLRCRIVRVRTTINMLERML